MKRMYLIPLFVIALGAAIIYGIFNGGYGNQTGTINPPSNSTSTNSTSTATTTPPIVINPNPSTTTPNPPPPATTTPNPPPPPPNPGPTPSEISYANRAKRQVVFTFDGGAGNQSHAEILAVLAKHGVTGTYFLTGNWAKQNPTLVAQMDVAGHEIFNHTLTHAYLTKISATQIRTELREAERIISGITGETTKPYFRAPYGERTQTTRDIAWSEGYRHVYWSTDAWDWRPGWTEEMVKQRIYEGLTPGAIYLMHIGDDITGNILDEVFTYIKSQGYSIVSLTQGLK